MTRTVAITLRALGSDALLTGLLAAAGAADESLIAPLGAILAAADGDGSIALSGGTGAANARTTSEPGQQQPRDGMEAVQEPRLTVESVHVAELFVSVDVSIAAVDGISSTTSLLAPADAEAAAEAGVKAALASTAANVSYVAVTATVVTRVNEEAPARHRQRALARRLVGIGGENVSTGDAVGGTGGAAPAATTSAGGGAAAGVTVTVRIDCGLNPASASAATAALSQLAATTSGLQLSAGGLEQGVLGENGMVEGEVASEEAAAAPQQLVLLVSAPPTTLVTLSVTISGVSGAWRCFRPFISTLCANTA